MTLTMMMIMIFVIFVKTMTIVMMMSVIFSPDHLPLAKSSTIRMLYGDRDDDCDGDFDDDVVFFSPDHLLLAWQDLR